MKKSKFISFLFNFVFDYIFVNEEIMFIIKSIKYHVIKDITER